MNRLPQPPTRRQKKKLEPTEITSVPALTRPTTSPVAQINLPTKPEGDAEAALEGDSLPAVGKVWDAGPKKSLATIMAEASRREEAPRATAPAPARVPQELQGAWSTLLDTVKTTAPRSHPPLASGEPRKDGSVVTVRFTGIWARLAKSLDPQITEYAAILSQALGETVEIRFEIDESAPPPAPARTVTQPGQPAAARPAGGNLPASPPPPRDGIPITPELRAQLEKEPLIRAFLESMSGNIVKVEEKEK